VTMKQRVHEQDFLGDQEKDESGYSKKREKKGIRPESIIRREKGGFLLVRKGALQSTS